jgi:hypothetical protein
MARTYYKYAEKQADSQVNWFQVGKDLTDMLKKETEVREQKKAAIDEASRQFGQELENAPQGNSDDVNSWTTNYAADMQQYRLMTDKLLKSGQMKVRDYTLIRQNTMDGTKNLFNLAKEYQAEFDEKSRRRDEDKSSAAEGQFMAMVEGFANLNQTKPLINPTTGAISVGKMEKGPDGVFKLKEGSDNYMTVNQLRNRIKEKIDKYQLNEALAGEVKLMGDVVNEAVTKTGSSTQTGFMTKITDPTLRKGLAQEGQQAVDAYINLENKIVQAKLSNPRHVSSILFDWSGGIDPKSGKPYQVVTDAKLAETSSHYVLWGFKDGIFQPDFESTANGKEQYKQAEDFTKQKLRGMLEQKTEVQPFQQPRAEYAPAYVYERGDKAKKDINAGNLIAKLYSGTPAEQQAAVTYFGGLPNVRSISRTNEGIVLTTTDGMTKPIPFINPATNQLMTQDDFVRSASSLLIGKDVDINKVLEGALGTGSKTFAQGTASMQAESTNPNEMFANYVSSSIPTLSTDETEAVTALAPILSRIGFSAREAKVGQDFVVIRNKDGVESEPIDLSDPASAAQSIQSFLLGNVPGKNEEERIMYLSGLAKKGALGGTQSAPKVVNAQGVGSKY